MEDLLIVNNEILPVDVMRLRLVVSMSVIVVMGGTVVVIMFLIVIVIGETKLARLKFIPVSVMLRFAQNLINQSFLPSIPFNAFVSIS